MPRDPKTLLGARIRLLRQNLGLSQEALAATTHLHRTYVGGIERGERNVSLENIVRIARALKVTASDLLHGVE